MIPQYYKDKYSDWFSYPVSKIRYIILRSYFKDKSGLKLNLGCGINYIPGFVNIDNNIFRKKDLFFDIKAGLPFKPGSVQLVFVSNLFEHFCYKPLIHILKEINRVIASGGCLRLLVPDLELGVKNYLKDNAGVFSDFPNPFKSTGGRFVNSLFCDGQHKIAFDFAFMKELLSEAGFKVENIIKLQAGRTSFVDQDIMEKLKFIEDSHISCCLFIEARK